MSRTLESRNPHDDERLATIPLDTDEEVERKLEACREGRKNWAAELASRLRCLTRLGDVLEQHSADLAKLATQEMGKPVSQAKAEIAKCVTLCRYSVQHGPRHLRETLISGSREEKIGVAYRPLGTILGIMPWNYPFWQAFRFIVPTLLAGNTVLLRHASNVPQCAQAIEKIAREASIGEDAFSCLFVDREKLVEIIGDSRVDGVSLTGSEKAGVSVGVAAARALKPTLLELGGLDPFIVLDDADVERAARIGVKARFQNSGQSCIAAKRFLVHESVADEFTEHFVEATRALHAGDPNRSETDLGPLAKRNLVEDVVEAVKDAREKGANMLVDGERSGEGNLVGPYVLEGVTSEMSLSHEEIFGPVAAIRRFDSVEEAIDVANETEFGLGASLWTGSESRGLELIPAIEAGMVFLNEMVASQPAIPFGGIAKSGHGRELGRDGTLAFTNRQTIYWNKSACLDHAALGASR